MSRFLDNCRLIEPTGVQLFLFLGCSQENETAPVGAVGKVKTPPPLRNFQAQWESLAFGLFHEASFSIALLPTDTAIEPEKETCGGIGGGRHSSSGDSQAYGTPG